MAHRGQEYCALPFRVGTEETYNLVVVESQSGSAQLQGIRAQIDFPADDSRFQLRRAVSPIAKSTQRTLQIRKKEDRDRRIARELLFQRQICRPDSKIAELQYLQPPFQRVVEVHSREQ